ncbi:MAG: T9SS type A sorting domain-containing protein, partial [Bacteroidota bacterium]
EIAAEATQFIKVGHFGTPTVAPNDWQKAEVSTGAFDCTAALTIYPPNVGGCKPSGFEYSVKLRQKVADLDGFGLPTGTYSYPLVSTSITSSGDNYIATDLPIGEYKIEYFVTNECGEDGTGEFLFEVKDLTEPIPVIDDELNISLGGDGIGRVCVADVDEGTWDNCQLVSTQIRRELWDEACRQSYLEEVLDVSSLADLQVEEFADGTKIWYRFEGIKRINLIHLDLTKDGLQYFTWWSDCVYFTCCDVSDSMTDFVVVEFRAEDKHQNVNVSWMDILIENKLTPTCIAPETAYFDCIDFKLDGGNVDEVRATFGTVDELLASKDLLLNFNCNVEVTDTIEWTPGDCSEGVLKRIFTVMAPTTRGIMSTSCTQTINIERVIDYQIKFPEDYEDVCLGDGGEDIEVETYGCDIFAINRDTVNFDVVADFCFKRYVTYTVINWCEYDGISLDPTIVPRDVDCDEDVLECTWVRVDDGTAYIDDDNNPKDAPVVSFSTTASSYGTCDEKTYGITPGFWQYTQVIKVYDNEAPVLEVEDLDPFCAFGATGAEPCNGEVMIPFSVSDVCTEEVEVRSVMLQVNNTGNPINATGELYILTDLGNGDFTISSIDGQGLPEGAHTFMVRVADKCGNVQVRNIPFTIVDCKTPAPICISILSVDLMPIVENKKIVGGMNVIWATDFVASSIEDCNPHPQADPLQDGKNEVRYYAVRQDSLLAAGLDAPTADYLTDDYRDVEFTCNDEGTAVLIYVIGVDGKDNFDWCTVMVNVTSGQDPCDGGTITEVASIAGLISTEEANAVEDVMVDLSGQFNTQLMTGDDGNYTFNELEIGYDYSVTPSLDADYLNGVSTFDLVLISKHILGLEQLNTPYKLIAADINNSRTITTLDLIQLRKLILSIDNEFSNNASWRFIPSDYTFPLPADPWSENFPEVLNINNFTDDMMAGDFTAIKVGDVNGSALANSLMAESRNVSGTFSLNVTDIDLTAGNEYEVSFTADELGVQGYQFTLDMEGLELVDVKYGLATQENFGFIADDIITTSYNQAGTGISDEVLFTLVLRAQADGKLSQFMNVSSRYTTAEAYGANNQPLNVALNFGGTAQAQQFEVYQNTPNPFIEQTQIAFTLPQTSEVTITFNDVTGKVLKVVNGQYGAGLNTLDIETAELRTTGIVYYTVETEDKVVTKKMVIIE